MAATLYLEEVAPIKRWIECLDIKIDSRSGLKAGILVLSTYRSLHRGHLANPRWPPPCSMQLLKYHFNLLNICHLQEMHSKIKIK